MPTENTNANEGESAGQTLTIESNGISMIASMGFDSAMDEEAQAGTKAKAETDGILQYLAYEGNGSYEPLIFRTDSGTMLIIGASKECYDGTVQLLSVGDKQQLSPVAGLKAEPQAIPFLEFLLGAHAQRLGSDFLEIAFF